MAAHNTKPLVGILLGSKSDWEIMRHCAAQLEDLRVPWEAQAISAHRAPDTLIEYLSSVAERGLQVIIAAAGGAAHLPGVCAAKTTLPVLGVPMESQSLNGLDSLLSIVQMPGGVPVGTLAIGKPGAINAALLAVSILGVKYPEHRRAYEEFRRQQTAKVIGDRVLKLPGPQDEKR
jgi:5-(carboxyamino)imidazole ribonucleotide mutase